MQMEKQEKRRQKHRRFLHVDTEMVTKTHKRWSIRLHPLFFATGLVYCFTGELFSFLLSCVVALQHECAHAFAAAKLGYTLNAVVLMPYGAVIDGDMDGISLKDEAFVAVCGPLCNLATAALFVAAWWFFPTLYAYTDTAYYSSVAIALVNLLPAYPLDGGRILRAAVLNACSRKQPDLFYAERKADRICKGVTLTIALIIAAVFGIFALRGEYNFSLLILSAFLLTGVWGNKEKAVYKRMDFSCGDILQKGALVRRVVVSEHTAIKNTLRYLADGEYLVLEVYDSNQNHLFDLPQNQLSVWFLSAPSPYATLGQLYEKRGKCTKNGIMYRKNG